MRYRAYSTARRSPPLHHEQKERALFREFGDLDSALNWAGRLQKSGVTTFAIEGDDGTHMDRHAIGAALWHLNRESIA